MKTATAELLFLVGSYANARWREPLRAAVVSAGIELIEGPAPEFFKSGQRVFVISDDPNWIVHMAPEQTHVFAGQDLPSLPLGPLSFQDRHEIFKLSRIWVIGADMIDRGAAHCDAISASVQIRGLGDISPLPLAPPLSSGHSPLAMYASMPPAVGNSADWPATLFSYQAEAFFEGDPALDLTGRGRILVHGPYLYLPKGRWRALVRFSAEPGMKAIPLRIEWGKEGDFDTTDVVIEEAGHYSLTMERDWNGPGAAQVVVSLTQAMFEGNLTFGDCRIEKIASSALSFDDPALEIDSAHSS